MEQIRARVDAIVEDPEDRRGPQAVLPLRLQAARPSTTSTCRRSTCRTCTSSTPPRWACSEINERGVVHDGVEYPLDVLDLRDRLPVDGDVDVQHGRRAAAAARSSEKWQTEGTKTFLGLHTHGLPEPVHRHRAPGRRRQLQLHRRHRRPQRLRRVDADDDARGGRRRRRRPQGGRRARGPQHCRDADIATAPLRDCLSYYNGHGEAAPGSLAYYGGSGWNHRCQQARGHARALRLRLRRPSTPRRAATAGGRETQVASERGATTNVPLCGRPTERSDGASGLACEGRPGFPPGSARRSGSALAAASVRRTVTLGE